jgi:hypothetical protein
MPKNILQLLFLLTLSFCPEILRFFHDNWLILIFVIVSSTFVMRNRVKTALLNYSRKLKYVTSKRNKRKIREWIKNKNSDELIYDLVSLIENGMFFKFNCIVMSIMILSHTPMMITQALPSLFFVIHVIVYCITRLTISKRFYKKGDLQRVKDGFMIHSSVDESNFLDRIPAFKISSRQPVIIMASIFSWAAIAPLFSFLLYSFGFPYLWEVYIPIAETFSTILNVKASLPIQQALLIFYVMAIFAACASLIYFTLSVISKKIIKFFLFFTLKSFNYFLEKF